MDNRVLHLILEFVHYVCRRRTMICRQIFGQVIHTIVIAQTNKQTNKRTYPHHRRCRGVRTYTSFDFVSTQLTIANELFTFFLFVCFLFIHFMCVIVCMVFIFCVHTRAHAHSHFIHLVDNFCR